MTISNIDKQLHEKLKKAQGDFMSDFKTQLYKLVDQAKAEQREEWIKKIETMKLDLSVKTADDEIWHGRAGYNQACEDFIKAIRKV